MSYRFSLALHPQVQDFKRDDSPVQLLLMTTHTCGLGTDLPRVDVAVLYDSDWHPRLDVQVSMVAKLLYCHITTANTQMAMSLLQFTSNKELVYSALAVVVLQHCYYSVLVFSSNTKLNTMCLLLTVPLPLPLLHRPFPVPTALAPPTLGSPSSVSLCVTASRSACCSWWSASAAWRHCSSRASAATPPVAAGVNAFLHECKLCF